MRDIGEVQLALRVIAKSGHGRKLIEYLESVRDEIAPANSDAGALQELNGRRSFAHDLLRWSVEPTVERTSAEPDRRADAGSNAGRGAVDGSPGVSGSAVGSSARRSRGTRRRVDVTAS